MMISYVLSFLCAIHFIATATVPSYIHVCHRNDPKVSECIRHSVEQLRPRLQTGIPEMEVPGLEPLRINDIIVRGSGNWNINMNLMNVDVTGCSHFIIDKLDLDISNINYHIEATFPLLRFKGNYIIDTMLLTIPIKGSGVFDANGTDCKCLAVLKGGIIDGSHGKEMHFTDLDFKFTISDYNIALGDIVKNNKEMSRIINEVVNSNQEELINLATPIIQENASETLLNLVNHIVRNFAYDEIFPK